MFLTVYLQLQKPKELSGIMRLSNEFVLVHVPPDDDDNDDDDDDDDNDDDALIFS